MNFVSEYKTIKKLKNSVSLRSIARSLALDALSYRDILAGVNDTYLKKNRVQFIYIHHVFTDEQQAFEQMVQRLLEHHTPLSYSEAVNKVLSGNIDRPYIVFSSDDGFKNNLWAANILKKYGVSGCFFINPTTINATSYEEIKEFCAKRLNLPPVEFMNWNDVDLLLKDGHEIGSHTQDHVKISEIPANAAKENIDISVEEITRRCGKVAHFAYPYGRYHHFNEEMRKYVADLGLSCASAERGCHITDGRTLRNDELFIRRDHVVLDWSLRHIIHFLVHNSKKADLSLNFSPYTNQLS